MGWADTHTHTHKHLDSLQNMKIKKKIASIFPCSDAMLGGTLNNMFYNVHIRIFYPYGGMAQANSRHQSSILLQAAMHHTRNAKKQPLFYSVAVVFILCVYVYVVLVIAYENGGTTTFLSALRTHTHLQKKNKINTIQPTIYVNMCMSFK